VGRQNGGYKSSGTWAKLWHKNKLEGKAFLLSSVVDRNVEYGNKKQYFGTYSSDTPHVVTATVRHWEYRDMGCWHIFWP
jgi:hypothetical protein